MLMSLTKTNMYFKCWLYHAQTQCIVYTEQTSHGQRCSTVILGVFLTGTMSGEFFLLGNVWKNWEMFGEMFGALFKLIFHREYSREYPHGLSEMRVRIPPCAGYKSPYL